MKELLFVLLMIAAFALVAYLESEEIPIDSRVKDYIEHCGIANPEIVYKQAILETGNFKSRLFKEDNNLFGMKYPRNRPTTAIGVNDNGSAIYYSWEHSILDYMIWQNKYYKSGDYYKFLKRVYAEDSVYVRKLKAVKL
jgi:uncharacterized FlgJ-related protein